MKRSLLLLALLYGYGDARLEAYRPDRLDRLVRSFHFTVDQAIADGRRAAVRFDEVRTMRYLAAGLRQLDRSL